MMTKEQILEKYRSNTTRSIFGFMFGQRYLNYGNGIKKLDKVIEISKEKLELSANKDCFFFVWGFPGPDINIYRFSDYGETWAFTEEELNV
jgi:hypothetical protein